jgi:hypothetical protein
VANSATDITLNIHFSAAVPSTAQCQQSTVPVGELKVSQVAPSSDEFSVDNVHVRLARINQREVHLKVNDDQYKIVAKSRMYPYADRNDRRKRLDLIITPLADEGAATLSRRTASLDRCVPPALDVSPATTHTLCVPALAHALALRRECEQPVQSPVQREYTPE